MDTLYLYCINAVLVFALQGHARNFKGDSQKALATMNFMVMIGALACTAFFFLHGYKVSWMESIGGLVGSMILGVLVPANMVVSMMAIVSIPVLSVAMFVL